MEVLAYPLKGLWGNSNKVGQLIRTRVLTGLWVCSIKQIKEVMGNLEHWNPTVFATVIVTKLQAFTKNCNDLQSKYILLLNRVSGLQSLVKPIIKPVGPSPYWRGWLRAYTIGRGIITRNFSDSVSPFLNQKLAWTIIPITGCAPMGQASIFSSLNFDLRKCFHYEFQASFRTLNSWHRLGD